MSIRKPTADGHSMLWVENIRSRRVVNNDGVFQVTPDLGKILDVIAAMIVTALPEKTVVYNTVDVELIQQWIAVLSTQH